MQHNNTSFCGRANSCPKRETSNFLAFLVNSFFSVFQSVCEVGALCLDVAVLLEQLEALLDGLLVLGHRLLVARRLRVVLQRVQQHVGPVVSLQVEQEERMKIINSLRQKKKTKYQSFSASNFIFKVFISETFKLLHSLNI